MRKVLHIACLLAVLLTAGACRRAQVEEQQSVGLTLRVLLPAAQSGTKAGWDWESVTEAERAIGHLQIWIFRHSDGKRLGYLDPDVSILQGGTMQEYFIPIDDLQDVLDMPAVDAYALVNDSSTGLTLNSGTSRDNLDAAVLTGEVFGPASAVSSVPAGGIPYSAVGKDLTLDGSFPVLHVATLTLKPAIAKLQVITCQLRDADGAVDQFVLNGITLGAGSFTENSFLFNDTAASTKTGGDALETVVDITPDAAPALNPDPEYYKRADGESVSSYLTRIQAGCTDGVLTSKVFYMRESPYRLSANIQYTVQDVQQDPVLLNMHDAGDLSRGCHWIVYVYYLRKQIRFSVSWTLWEQGHDFNLTD